MNHPQKIVPEVNKDKAAAVLLAIILVVAFLSIPIAFMLAPRGSDAKYQTILTWRNLPVGLVRQ